MGLSTFIENFHLLRPQWLLILVPLLSFIYLNWRREQEKRQWQTRIPKHLLNPLLIDQNKWTQSLPTKAASVLAILYVLILSGPSWEREISPLTENKSPAIVLLDLSESMLQADVTPNRLERAKFKLRDLLVERGSAQTALIVFAGSAHTVLPLTNDPEVFLPMLSALEPDLIPVKGKKTSLVIPLIKQIMDTSELPATVILMADGLGIEPTAPFLEYFNEHHTQLLVLGIGNEQVVSDKIKPLESDALAALAQSVSGSYMAMTQEQQDIDWLQKKIKQHLVASADTVTPWKDFGYYLLFPTMLVALFWFRKGWTIQWCLLVALMVTPARPIDAKEWQFVDLWLTEDQQAELAYRDGDYMKAAALYKEEMSKGKAYYMAGQYEKAQSYFEQVEGPEARFNEANALAHQLEFDRAISKYQSLLKDYPNHPFVVENLATIEELVKRLKQSGSDKGKLKMEDKQQGESGEGGDSSSESQGAGKEDKSTSKDNKKNSKKDSSKDQTGVVGMGGQQEGGLTAEELLMNPDLVDKWTQEVEAGPAEFLRAKFKVQQEKRDAELQDRSADNSTALEQ